MHRTLSRMGSLLVLSAFAASTAPPSPDRFRADQRKYWAFQPVVAHPTPKVAAAAWVKNPIDSFISAKLQEKSISPGAEADRITLMRRAYFDLTGLPPSVAEVDAYLADK